MTLLPETLETGAVFAPGPGFLHRELGGAAYRVVSGFKIKLTEFTMPIDKRQVR